MKIYKLTSKLQKCTHGKFNHIIDSANVNCDLGVYADVTDEQGKTTSEFQPQYTSAVVKKTRLVNYSDADATGAV